MSDLGGDRQVTRPPGPISAPGTGHLPLSGFLGLYTVHPDDNLTRYCAKSGAMVSLCRCVTVSLPLTLFPRQAFSRHDCRIVTCKNWAFFLSRFAVNGRLLDRRFAVNGHTRTCWIFIE